MRSGDFFDYKRIPVNDYRDSVVVLREMLKEEGQNEEGIKALVSAVLNASSLMEVLDYSESTGLSNTCYGVAQLLFALTHPTLVSGEYGGFGAFCDSCSIDHGHLYYNSASDIGAALSDVISSELSEWMNQM